MSDYLPECYDTNRNATVMSLHALMFILTCVKAGTERHEVVVESIETQHA